MDWYPLFNSLRIAAISTAIVFVLGTFIAYYVTKLPKIIRGLLDVILTLPLVLPPIVVGYLILRLLRPDCLLGALVLEHISSELVITWWSAAFAAAIISFPLMYRAARIAFASFDRTLSYAAQTLGHRNLWIFWRIQIPYCKSGILAGTVLAFARALGEYGATAMVAGYTPGKTATISTAIYELWRTGDDALAVRWILVDLAISVVSLIAVYLLDRLYYRTAVQKEVL